jgi:hypothetical protein
MQQWLSSSAQKPIDYESLSEPAKAPTPPLVKN